MHLYKIPITVVNGPMYKLVTLGVLLYTPCTRGTLHTFFFFCMYTFMDEEYEMKAVRRKGIYKKREEAHKKNS